MSVLDEVIVKEEQLQFEYQDVETENENKKYDDCNIEFPNNTELMNQLFMHKKGSPSQCTYCGKTFFKDYDLKNHIRTHTGEKPYECSQCNQAFAQSRYLKRHMKTHTGEKPYMCSSCGKAFPEMIDLKKHMRTHTGEKPHQCSHCDIGFVDKRSLEKHLRKHTLDDLHCPEASTLDKGPIQSNIKTEPKEKSYLYQCSYCDMIFSKGRILESHIRLNHKEKIPTISKQYKCSSCDETFAIVNCINDQETNTTNDSYKCNKCVTSFVNEKFLVNHHQNVVYLPSEIKVEDSNPQYSDVDTSNFDVSLKRSSKKQRSRKRNIVDDLDPNKAPKTQCISCKNEYINIYNHVFKSSLCKQFYDIDLLKRQAKEAQHEKNRRYKFVYRQRQMAKDTEGFRAKQNSYQAAARKRKNEKNLVGLALETEIVTNKVDNIQTENLEIEPDIYYQNIVNPSFRVFGSD